MFIIVYPLKWNKEYLPFNTSKKIDDHGEGGGGIRTNQSSKNIDLHGEKDDYTNS